MNIFRTLHTCCASSSVEVGWAQWAGHAGGRCGCVRRQSVAEVWRAGALLCVGVFFFFFSGFHAVFFLFSLLSRVFCFFSLALDRSIIVHSLSVFSFPFYLSFFSSFLPFLSISFRSLFIFYSFSFFLFTFFPFLSFFFSFFSLFPVPLFSFFLF